MLDFNSLNFWDEIIPSEPALEEIVQNNKIKKKIKREIEVTDSIICNVRGEDALDPSSCGQEYATLNAT